MNLKQQDKSSRIKFYRMESLSPMKYQMMKEIRYSDGQKIM